MRLPVRSIAENLVWTDTGQVWAVYRVSPVTFVRASRKSKLDAHAVLTQALMGLPGESTLLGVSERVDPWSVVDQVANGVDLAGHPAWRAGVQATATQLEQAVLYRRSHFLAFELPTAGLSSLRSTLASAGGVIGGAFGLPATPVTAVEVDTRRRQAERLLDRLGRLQVTPATPGTIRWLYARALRRGVDDPVLDGGWEPAQGHVDGRRSTRVTPPVLAHLADAVVVEGGTKSDRDRPRHRRYLKVDTPAGVAYQTFLVVADMPREWAFPGDIELLADIEDSGVGVDWCIRVRSVDNAAATVKAKRKHRQLIAQGGEYAGDISGAPTTLHAAVAGINREQEALAANRANPELQCTFVFGLAADNLAALESAAARLQSQFEPFEYGLARPTGDQLRLLRATLPGSAASAPLRDYTQFLLPADLASCAPWTATDVGDPHGMVLGDNLDQGGYTPVLFDPAWGPQQRRTGSIGAFGALGAGKSYLAKKLAWATCARGGQVLALDRTSKGEYVKFAGALADAGIDTSVVQLDASSSMCLDPLRVFTGDARVSVAVGFLSLLAGVASQSLESAALEEAVERAVTHREPRMSVVLDELRAAGAAGDPDASVVARKIARYTRRTIGKLVFGDGQPLQLDASFVVFAASGLSLANRDTLLNEHLSSRMVPEQVFSQALLYLVAAFGRHAALRDDRRFVAYLQDEGWAVTASPQGQALLEEFARDGRKHNAAVWFFSQHPADVGSPELVGLLGPRFVFRQGSRDTARAALDFAGVDGDDHLVDLLSVEPGRGGLESGTCLYRDLQGRVAMIQVGTLPLPALHDAALTDPPPAMLAVDVEVGERRSA